MNPTLLAFGFFGAVFLGAILIFGTRLIIRWSRLRRERSSAPQEASQSAPAHPVPDAEVAPPAAAMEPPPIPDSYPEPPPLPGEAAVPEQPVPELVGAGHASESWVPPQPQGWQPESNFGHEVSWTNDSLFHQKETTFEEPEYIPKVLPSDIPTNTEDYVLGSATPALASLMPMTDRQRVVDELAQGGYYQPHAIENLLAIRITGIMVSLIFFGALFLVAPPAAEIPIAIAALVFPGLCWAVPRVVIQNRATQRKSEIERAMPDMLDMLNMCVSQGLTIRASLTRIAGDLKPVYPVLAGELAIVSRQADAGNLQVALTNFGDRVDVPEVDSFVSLMNQAEQMGTSVSDALTEYSNTMRESLRQRTDEKANKASFKLMFPTVLCMMPAVFMFLMGPAILELQDFFDSGGADNVQSGADAINQVDSLQQTSQ